MVRFYLFMLILSYFCLVQICLSFNDLAYDALHASSLSLNGTFANVNSAANILPVTLSIEGDKKCSPAIIRVTNLETLKIDSSRPQVLISGEIHGDERVGAQASLRLAEILVWSANCEISRRDEYCRKLDQIEISKKLRIWLAFLATTRDTTIIPATNCLGYINNRRDDGGIDPNRDFGYSRKNNNCLLSNTAKILHYLFQRSLFQIVITFHGGMEAIGYEWGSTNHHKPNDQSPDDSANINIAAAMRDFAGGIDSSKTTTSTTTENNQKKKSTTSSGSTGSGYYPIGPINSLVYPVEGGMEDWVYAAGWDQKDMKNCSGLLPSATTTATTTPTTRKTTGTTGITASSESKAESNRALVFLVETSKAKQPADKQLGSESQMFSAVSSSNGHVPRNVRLSVVALDMVQPYVCLSQVTTTTTSSSSSSSSMNSTATSNSSNDSSRIPLDSRNSLQLSWYVGGGVTVDATWVSWHHIPTLTGDSTSNVNRNYIKKNIDLLVSKLQKGGLYNGQPLYDVLETPLLWTDLSSETTGNKNMNKSSRSNLINNVRRFGAKAKSMSHSVSPSSTSSSSTSRSKNSQSSNSKSNTRNKSKKSPKQRQKQRQQRALLSSSSSSLSFPDSTNNKQYKPDDFQNNNIPIVDQDVVFDSRKLQEEGHQVIRSGRGRHIGYASNIFTGKARWGMENPIFPFNNRNNTTTATTGFEKGSGGGTGNEEDDDDGSRGGIFTTTISTTSTTTLSSDSPHYNSSNKIEYLESGYYWLVVWAAVDQSWGHANQGFPRGPPKSYISNARTNSSWSSAGSSSGSSSSSSESSSTGSQSTSSTVIRGRRYWASDPIVVMVRNEGSIQEISVISSVSHCAWWDRKTITGTTASSILKKGSRENPPFTPPPPLTTSISNKVKTGVVVTSKVRSKDIYVTSNSPEWNQRNTSTADTYTSTKKYRSTTTTITTSDLLMDLMFVAIILVVLVTVVCLVWNIIFDGTLPCGFGNRGRKRKVSIDSQRGGRNTLRRHKHLPADNVALLSDV